MKSIISQLVAAKHQRHDAADIDQGRRTATTPAVSRTSIRVVTLIFLQVMIMTLFYGIWLFLDWLAWKQDTIILTMSFLGALFVVVGIALRDPPDEL